jgi:hypothetical protein
MSVRQSASPPSFSVVAVERYKVKKGDALDKIAAKNDLDRAMLAYFNWGVYSPQGARRNSETRSAVLRRTRTAGADATITGNAAHFPDELLPVRVR